MSGVGARLAVCLACSVVWFSASVGSVWLTGLHDVEEPLDEDSVVVVVEFAIAAWGSLELGGPAVVVGGKDSFFWLVALGAVVVVVVVIKLTLLEDSGAVSVLAMGSSSDLLAGDGFSG